jgi:hypothetical protein
VGSEELEHKPIARPEVALLRVEEERPRVAGAGRRDPYLEFVLVRAKDGVVRFARALGCRLTSGREYPAGLERSE